MRNRFLFPLLFFSSFYVTFNFLNCIFLKLRDIQFVKEPKKSIEINAKIWGGSLIFIILCRKFFLNYRKANEYKRTFFSSRGGTCERNSSRNRCCSEKAADASRHRAKRRVDNPLSLRRREVSFLPTGRGFAGR